jgi:hypothetical protein
MSPSVAVASVMRAPFRKVPLLDPRSRTRTPPAASCSSACRREMVGSKIGTSLVAARPTSFEPEAGRSMC